MEKSKIFYVQVLFIIALGLMFMSNISSSVDKSFKKTELKISNLHIANNEIENISIKLNSDNNYYQNQKNLVNYMNLSEEIKVVKKHKTNSEHDKQDLGSINTDNLSENVRVIEYKSSEITALSDNGCETLEETTKFNILSCPNETAQKFNLQEDFQLRALDLDADLQVKATNVWSTQIYPSASPVEVPTSISLSNSNSTQVSIHNSQIFITVNSLTVIGAKYELFSKDDLLSNQWNKLDEKLALDSQGLVFVQPMSDSMRFFKVIMEMPAVNLTGKDRVIVVLDSGYNYNHPDLTSSYLGGYDFVNHDNDPMDDNGHGSHIAGLITADGIANISDKGVAPETGIVSGKVLDNNGLGYFSDVLLGIYWAVDNYHPDVISLSMGSFEPNIYKDGCNNLYPAFTDAVNYALYNNVSFVASAGNNGVDGVSFPGCIDNSFTVGSVNNADELAGFSGIGQGVDIYAPGINLFSTSLNNDYDSLSGTSVSTPIVSGVIALMKQKNSNLSAREIQNIIISSSDNFNNLDVNFNRINALSSINLI